MINRILLFAVLLSSFLLSCKKSTKNKSVVTSVNWTVNSQTYSANNIQLDYQGYSDGYYEVDATADATNETSELIFGINNGASTGDHAVPTYWVYCSITNKSTMNQESYVFESYTLNISSVFNSYVSGSFTANKILGPTLTCNFSDINSSP